LDDDEVDEELVDEELQIDLDDDEREHTFQTLIL
jgi:hypothetical protein